MSWLSWLFQFLRYGKLESIFLYLFMLFPLHRISFRCVVRQNLGPHDLHPWGHTHCYITLYGKRNYSNVILTTGKAPLKTERLSWMIQVGPESWEEAPQKLRWRKKEVRETGGMRRTWVTLPGLKMKGATWKTWKGEELRSGFFLRVSTKECSPAYPLILASGDLEPRT